MINIHYELLDLVNNVSSITDNYYKSGDTILNRDGEAVAFVTDDILYAGYVPLSSRRLVEIDILRRIFPARVMVVPSTILNADLIDDTEFIDEQWYQFFYLLSQEYNRKDASKKKALFHLNKLYDMYVNYYVLKGRRTPEKAASFLNTFIDFTIMQQEVEAIEVAARGRRINEFYEYDLQQWREFQRQRIHNETDRVFLRYLADEKAFEATCGSRVHQTELRRFWNQYINTGSAAMTIFHPMSVQPRLCNVTPTIDGHLMIEGFVLTAEELESALIQIQD